MSVGILKNKVDPLSSKHEQINTLGMNTGNLVFWESLQRLFQPVNIPYAESEKIGLCDKVIITDLIWIRENSEYEYLENIIEMYKIPFIPISIGLQSNYYKKDFKLSDGTVRLLKKLEERAVLGLRGEYTADILNKYGIKNVSVIGCPSMYYWNNRNLMIESNKIPIKCSSNFKTFYGVLNVPEKHFLSYCAQKSMQFIEQTEREFTIENAKDQKYFNFINQWLTKNLVIPSSYQEWCDYLKNIDFSIGGRFHGNVIALWNNIKALFLTVDSRTKELTDFFRLPAFDLYNFNDRKPIEYYYQKADYSDFNKYYPVIYDNFLDFVKKNGLQLNPNAKPLTFGISKENSNNSNGSIVKSNNGNTLLDIHNTNYRRKNIVKLTDIEKSNNVIKYSFTTEGAFSDYFINSRPFTIEYDCNMESVPDSVAALPFIALMLPLCWLMDATIYVDEIDEDFFYSIDNIKRGYISMYPTLEFKGHLVAEKVIKNRVDHINIKSLCFFSGGVDAVSTMLSNLQYRPTLFTLWGTDVYFEQPEAWNIVKAKNMEVAKQFNLDFASVKTAFRYVLNEKLLTEHVAKTVHENWWHGFQHGIALIAHAAPYAYINNITIINIASSYSVRDTEFNSCASYPTIDAMVNFCGCKIYHDGFEKSRTDKIREIYEYSTRYNQAFSLRVCWQVITGENCCVCEKCQRTIFGIWAVGGDPEKMGFNLNATVRMKILESLNNDKFHNSVFWEDIKSLLYEQKDAFQNNELVMALLKNYVPKKKILKFYPTVTHK